MLPGDFRDTFIHDPLFFFFRKVRVECQHVGHIRVGVLRGQFPADLYNGTVNLDAEEVFRLACYADGCLESYLAVYIRHGRLADERVSIPRTAVLPRQTVGRLAVLHDGRDTVVVVRRHVIVVCRFLLRISVFLLFLLPLGQFCLQLSDTRQVGVVLLPVNGSILYTGLGYFLQQLLVLILQCLDL